MKDSDPNIYTQMRKHKQSLTSDIPKSKPSDRLSIDKHNARTTTLKAGFKTVEIPDIGYVTELEKSLETATGKINSLEADMKTLRDKLNQVINEMNRVPKND